MLLHTRKAAAIFAVAGVLSTAALTGTATPFVPLAHAQVALNGIPQTANITVHKYLGDAVGGEGDGTVVPTDDLSGVTPAVGVTFYAYKVDNIDLTKQEGWTAARDLSATTFYATGPSDLRSGTAPAGSGLTRVEQSITTGEEGSATFTNLPVGLYLIVEQANPIINGQPTIPTAPFFVTAPMTSPNSESWNTDIHVYPKNQNATPPTKLITDPVPTGGNANDLTGSAVGEQIGYTITAPVDQLPSGQHYTGFVVADKLPAELDLDQLSSVVVKKGDVTLNAETDYDLATYQVGATDPKRWVLRVALKEDALTALGQNAGEAITVTFQAKVSSLPGTTLDNKAFVYPQDPGIDTTTNNTWDPEDPDNNPNTPAPGSQSTVARAIYGTVAVTKTGENDAALAGAKFELHRCEADGTLVADSKPIQVKGASSWTTEGDPAVINIDGVHLGNVTTTTGSDGAITGDTYEDIWSGKGTQFCLLETAAPDGYAKLLAPYLLPELAGDESITTLVNATAEIKNIKDNQGFNLPLTGGAGLWGLLGGGALLLLIAATYYARLKKNQG